jgi:heme a synthase
MTVDLAPQPAHSSRSRFGALAWAVLGYTLLVIMYGAWVRVTGSGAGCGDHWPTCNGQVVPRDASAKTWIEYGHRLTSGILGPLAIAQVVWAFVDRRQARMTRWCALFTLVFIIFEALIGAGIVLAELVADNTSAARAIVVALHLTNTLVLTALAALTAWFGSGNPVPSWRGLRFRYGGALAAGLVAVVIVSGTGAITALGDTLFPTQSVLSDGLWARVSEELSPGAHFLVRLRAVHPVLAVIVGVGVATVGSRFADEGKSQAAQLGRLLGIVTWTQMALGSLNLVLAAPAWLQLLHLLGAQLTWILLVLLFVEASRSAVPEAATNTL